MNRRLFVASLVAVPISGFPFRTEGKVVDAEYWARRNFEPIDPHDPVLGIHPMVLKYADVASAGIAIGQLQTDGFLHMEGFTKEDFPPVETLPTPEGIGFPSALRRYMSVAPPSSGFDEIPYLSLDVQRDDVLVSLMVRGADEPLVLETLLSLSQTMLGYKRSHEEPVMDQTGRRTGGLWDLLLQEADIPEGFRLYQEGDNHEVVSFNT
jgi:hypothetical protein